MASLNSTVRPRARLKKIARGVSVTRVPLSVGVVELFRFEGYAHAFPRHSHEQLTFGVFGAGNGRIRVRGAEWQAAQGSILAIGPDEPHSAEPARGGGWTYRSFYPSPAVVAAALGTDSPGRPDRFAALAMTAFERPVIEDPGLARSIDRLHRQLECGEADPELEERLLILIGKLVTRHGARPPEMREDSATGAVARARAFLEANPGAPIRLQDLSDVAGVSPFHLIRCFQRKVGMPPHAWLTQVRANRARGLLLAGEAPTSVAYRCGFSDQSHLTRTFRSMFGMTPGAYVRGV